MSAVTRASDASIDASTAMYAPQLTGFIAGEDLELLGPCYIKTSDGKVYNSTGTADNEAAEFAGINPRGGVKAGQPVTLLGLGTRFRLAASGLTVGNILYISATAGTWDTAPTTGDAIGTLQVISATDVRVIRTAVAGTINPSAAGGVTFADTKMFVSAEQTGTGSAQNVAHGLGAAPAGVLIVPTDTSPSTVGVYTAVEGTHTSTNVVVTVTSGKKFKVWAMA